jgi:hypothetical protein
VINGDTGWGWSNARRRKFYKGLIHGIIPENESIKELTTKDTKILRIGLEVASRKLKFIDGE